MILTRKDREGNEVSYSASWYKQHMKAVKQVVRYALDHALELKNGQRWIIEKYLKYLRLKKIVKGISKSERVPDDNEVKTMIRSADVGLGLIIEFLVETGCRISEMIDAEVGRSRRQPRLSRITVIGKGEKKRDLRCRTGLYDRIRKKNVIQEILQDHFSLFEENYDTQYSKKYGQYRIIRIKESVEKFIECGDCSKGIARIKCTNTHCKHEYFRPFVTSLKGACKSWYLCPSCN